MSIGRAAEYGHRQIRLHRINTLLPFLYFTRTIAEAPKRRNYASFAAQRTDAEPVDEIQDALSGIALSPSRRSARRPTQPPRQHEDNLRTKAGRRQDDGQREGGRGRTDRQQQYGGREQQYGGRTQQYGGRKDHVPFENLSHETASIQDELAGSTITPSERRSFEGLFKLQRASENGKASQRQEKPTSNTPGMKLEAILNHVEKNIQAEQRRNRPKPEMPKALQSMMEREKQVQPLKRSEMEQRLVDQDQAKQKAIQAEQDKVHHLLKTAGSDVELWKVLQVHVFDRLKALNLDAQEDGSKENNDQDNSSQPNNDIKPPDLDILAATAPVHLRNALRQLRERFTGSSLAFAILPTLRSLGPSAVAVGASTHLFNAHLFLIHSTQPSNLLGMVSVLEEMDRLVYEFNAWTVGILKRAEKETLLWLSGRRGEGGRAAFRSPAVRTGLSKIRLWIGDIEARLQADALRQTIASHELRRIEQAEEAAELRTIQQ